ncbi:MAG: hypothetical protein R3E79_16235 [Caldilineaceae bacterium]
MVFQDGKRYVDEAGWFRTPLVFDSLIHAGEMPATVEIFLNPGHIGEKPRRRLALQQPFR